MASVIKKQTIIGSNMSETEDGIEDVAIFFVEGLDASGAEKKYQALTTPGVPRVGDPHPFIPGIVARSIPRIEVKKGGFHATVEVQYAVPSEEDGGGGGGGGGPDGTGNLPGTVRLGVVYERVPSNFAVNIDGTKGDPIHLKYDHTVSFDPGGSQTGSGERDATTTQIGEVNNYIARPTVIIRGNTAFCPLGKGLKTGFTNSDNFLAPIANLFDVPPDGTADTWLLIRTSANSTDNNASFDFEFEWAYKKEKWYEVAVFIDPKTGRPPGNIKEPTPFQPGGEGNGTRVVRIAGQTAFQTFVTL